MEGEGIKGGEGAGVEGGESGFIVCGGSSATTVLDFDLSHDERCESSLVGVLNMNINHM